MTEKELSKLYDLCTRAAEELRTELTPAADKRTIAALAAAHTLGDWAADRIAELCTK